MEMGPIGDTVYGVHQGHASPLYQDQTQHTVDRYTILAEGASIVHSQYQTFLVCEIVRCGIEAD